MIVYFKESSACCCFLPLFTNVRPSDLGVGIKRHANGIGKAVNGEVGRLESEAKIKANRNFEIFTISQAVGFQFNFSKDMKRLI